MEPHIVEWIGEDFTIEAPSKTAAEDYARGVRRGIRMTGGKCHPDSQGW